MREKQEKYSFEVQGLSRGETFVPLSQAARIAELLSAMPIEIADAGNCRIEVKGPRIDIYGLDRGLNQCRVTDAAQVIDIKASSEGIEFELKGGSFSKIVVHFKQISAPSASYQTTLSSSGESRSGYGSRASG